MARPKFELFLFVLVAILLDVNAGNPDYSTYWVVELDGLKDPKQIAEETQFEYMGKIPGDDELHRFRLVDDHTLHKRAAHHHTERLMKHPRIRRANQEIILDRKKRDFLEDLEEVSTRTTDDNDDLNEESLRSYENIYQRKEAESISNLFNDPYWKKEWYLHDTRTDLSKPKVDLHVHPVWKRGITGKGIVVTVIDDGVLGTHPDLKANFMPDASYDFNGDNKNNPTPRETRRNLNKHGTRCAGEIAMVANNSICGVGVAYNAKIGGIRMLDGIVTDSIEASSLSFGIGTVDIYSASWGPTDNGKTMEGPGPLAMKALERGIKKGRNGLGSLYMWASGNGGAFQDDCTCDGYASSIYTIAINSVTSDQHAPYYIELCPSTMATTYSGSYGKSNKVVGTDLHNKCTDQHGGTSASAPLAAGIMALVLETNPSITWRDAQHLVAWTSEVHSLFDNPGWQLNAAGFYVNLRFGFGLMNADSIVEMANKNSWKSVPPKSTCEQNTVLRLEKHLYSGQTITASINSDGCRGESNEINFLEHVQVNLTMKYSRRGALSISLISPAGSMKTQMLRRRIKDKTNGPWSWTFTSVHNWGENPRGLWLLQIEDSSGIAGNEGTLESFKLILHGTKDMPDHVKRAPNHRRRYNMNYNSVKNIRSEEAMTVRHEPKPSFIQSTIRNIMEGLHRLRPYPEELSRYFERPKNIEEN